MRDALTRLLWLASGAPLPALTGAAAAPLTGVLAQQREKFNRNYSPPLPRTISRLKRGNAPAEPLVWVQMDGGKEDLVYRRDGVVDPAEELVFLTRPRETIPSFASPSGRSRCRISRSAAIGAIRRRPDSS